MSLHKKIFWLSIIMLFVVFLGLMLFNPNEDPGVLLSRISIVVALVLALFSPLFVLIDFVRYYAVGKRFGNKIFRFLEFVVIALNPVLFFFWQSQDRNSCCGESALFSPDHKLSIMILVGMVLFFYFLSSYKNRLFGPLLEAVINIFLLLGFVLNIFIAIDESAYWFHLPIAILLLVQLSKNHRLIMNYLDLSINK